MPSGFKTTGGRLEAITTVNRLRELLGEPGPLTRHKIHPALSPQARNFIQRAPFFLLATVDEYGHPTVSPKGDAAGFVQVEDAGTLLVPERSGNRLLFSLENILRHPQVGLLFLSPGTDETLRIGGRASLIHDDALNVRFAARGKPALLVMKIDIDTCYFHCAKSVLRSGLWQPSTWPEPLRVSFAEEIHLNNAMAPAAREELDSQIAGRYQTDL